MVLYAIMMYDHVMSDDHSKRINNKLKKTGSMQFPNLFIIIFRFKKSKYFFANLWVCKIFSHALKPIYGLLASKRRPIDLQKMPFKTLTNALLASN